MTIDTNFLIDTSLSTVAAETLMTKAFELTHRLDGLKQYNGTAPGAAKIAEIREQRDAIVREMQRRTDALERALVTVETTERVMRGANEALSGVYVKGPGHFVVDNVRDVLVEAMEETTNLTCTLVKDQTLSDRISRAARERVKAIREKIEA